MPLTGNEEKATNKDKSLNDEYCIHCYKDGEFTSDITMDEMIELNLKYLDEWNKSQNQNWSIDAAREELKSYMPTLKRWKTG